MTKYRVHLEHDKSVVVEADEYVFGDRGELRFRGTPSSAIQYLPIVFSPTRWVWVEEEKE